MDLRIFTIETGTFKLDGGSMFGVVPKTMWSKQTPADEKNLVTLSLRSLLIDDSVNRILIDSGMGNKQSEKFYSYYSPNRKETLLSSLEQAGYQPENITHVVHTHLHFDHCGGAVYRGADGELKLTFPNAKYLVSEKQWQNAMQPNARERASYFPENIMPFEKLGALELVSAAEYALTSDVVLKQFEGHTAGLLLPFVTCGKRELVFAGDLIPTATNIPTAWIAGYDTTPLNAFEEKKKVLEEAAANNSLIVFQHDVDVVCATVAQTEKGVRLAQTYDYFKQKLLQ